MPGRPRPPPRPRICARHRFAITLYWLASGAIYRVVGDAFSVSTPAVCKILHETIPILNAKLCNRFITFPTGAKLTSVVNAHELMGGLPMCAGAIDGTFVEMKKPTGEHNHVWWCYKNKIGILVLAVVDDCKVFTYVKAGAPASAGDASVYDKSALKMHLENGTLFASDVSREVEGVTVRPFIVGVAAFPLAPYLIKCYGGARHASSKEGAFNAAVVTTRREVEMAFGAAKGRWRAMLHGFGSQDPDFVTAATEVCFALHNICELAKQPFDPALLHCV